VEADPGAVPRTVERCRPRWRAVERRAEGERWGAEMGRVAVDTETETESPPPPTRRGGRTASMARAAACACGTGGVATPRRASGSGLPAGYV
jgi:hypothetical protein